MVSSVPRNFEMLASSCLCTDCVPQMKRTEAVHAVAVGAEVEDVGTAAEVDLGALRAVDDTLGLVEAVGTDLIDGHAVGRGSARRGSLSSRLH
jgi:hypothetical protein